MEYEKMKEIIKDMENSKLTELEINFPDGTKIAMKKENQTTNKNIVPVVPETIAEKIDTKKQNEIKETKKEGNIITAPMVGTFYLKPDPNSDPYVEVGKRVKKGDVVCIIEAMKLMNEIESEYDGEVVEVLVEDGNSVEYGTPLFRVL